MIRISYQLLVPSDYASDCPKPPDVVVQVLSNFQLESRESELQILVAELDKGFV